MLWIRIHGGVVGGYCRISGLILLLCSLHVEVSLGKILYWTLNCFWCVIRWEYVWVVKLLLKTDGTYWEAFATSLSFMICNILMHIEHQYCWCASENVFTCQQNVYKIVRRLWVLLLQAISVWSLNVLDVCMSFLQVLGVKVNWRPCRAYTRHCTDAFVIGPDVSVP